MRPRSGREKVAETRTPSPDTNLRLLTYVLEMSRGDKRALPKIVRIRTRNRRLCRLFFCREGGKRGACGDIEMIIVDSKSLLN